MHKQNHQQFKTEINNASVPSKAILNLVYAKCLVDYQNTNSYLLYNRTNTVSLMINFNMDIERLFGTNRSCFRKNTTERSYIKTNLLK
jgi:hypothetical protein